MLTDGLKALDVTQDVLHYRVSRVDYAKRSHIYKVVLKVFQIEHFDIL